MNYLGTTGLRHLIRKIRTELRDLQDLITEKEENIAPTHWAEVQQIVRNGLAQSTFSVGDTFQCMHSDLGLLTWQIVGFDANTPSDEAYTHSMTLQLKDPVQTLSYDGPDFFYWAQEEMSPGDYWFPLPDGSGTCLSFSLDVTVPQGSVFVLRMPESESVPDAKVSVYEDLEGQIRLTTVSVAEGSYGTELTPYSESKAVLWGNCTWSGCALDQYLNSMETKENVWDGTRPGAGCPEWVGVLDGFPVGLDEEFRNVLGYVNIKTYDNSIDEYTVTEEQFFLPTVAQVFGDYPTLEDSHREYEYYYDDETFYGDPSEGDMPGRVKTYKGVPCRWWLRASATSDDTNVPIVNEDGAITTAKATAVSVGVAPMCCIV